MGAEEGRAVRKWAKEKSHGFTQAGPIYLRRGLPVPKTPWARSGVR